MHTKQALTLLLLPLLLVLACARHGRPVEETGWTRLEVPPSGWLRFAAGECEGADRQRLVDSARATIEAFAEVYPERRDRLRLDGLYVYGERDPHTRSGRPVYGLYRRSKRLVLFRCGYENVIRHELVHHYCEELRLPCDCARMDHPAGYDMRCRETD